MGTVELYCYYKIDLEKSDIYRVLAKKIIEFYSKQPECRYYRFSTGLDPERKNTVMESGEFTDTGAFHVIQENIEKQNPEIFGALDAIIQGGLKARKYEFFTSLE